MRTKFVVYIAAMIMSCSVAYGVTLTFDEVPSGTVLHFSSYASNNRVFFSEDFRASDHTGSSWGPPHSGSNVLTSVGGAYSRILLGDITVNYAHFDAIQSVSAYFSTNAGAMVRITAYHIPPGEPEFAVGSVVIGALGESWDNRPVEITTSPNSPFEMLTFEGVNSPTDLLGFSADDMMITLIPEPSSLLALAGGLGALGLGLRRRRG